MRRAVLAILASYCFCGQAGAQAEPPAVAGTEPARECSPVERSFGSSRTVEIDTAGGVRFGQQYPGEGFLEDGEVVLTFDDGPLRRYTQPVLDALDFHCAKATFFVVGRMAVADADMLKDVARRGHTVGTHTWSHKNIRSLGAASAEREIELAVSVASKVIGAPVAPFFRFPYLSDSKGALAYFGKRNFGVFSIDIDTKDYRTRGAAQVEKRVFEGLERQKKGVILFHDIQASTARAIKDLLGELKARGYKIVHITAKAPAETLPEYDAMAEQIIDRKNVALAANPLASRSVVWPVADGAGEETSRLEKASLRKGKSSRRGAGRSRRRNAQVKSDAGGSPFGVFGP